MSEFTKERHIKFLRRALLVLPEDYASLDQNRMTVVFFTTAGLDLLGALDQIDVNEVIEWVYAQQVVPEVAWGGEVARCGFRGGSFAGAAYPGQEKAADDDDDDADDDDGGDGCGCVPLAHDYGHLAFTYAALCTLAVCGDGLERVDREALLGGVAALQLADGSFRPLAHECESDMRFLYTATAICAMLGDVSVIDVDAAVAYVLASICWDGGIGQGPNEESHAGSTFCAIGTLVLLDRLDALTPLARGRLVEWLVARQQFGFQGRPNKKTDTCYSYWVGASLALLDAYHFVDIDTNTSFVLSTQQAIGGLAKWPDHHPDPLHTHLGLCGLSLLGVPGIAPINPALGISAAAAAAAFPSVGPPPS